VIELAECEHVAVVVDLQTVPGAVTGSYWTAAVCHDAGGTGVLKQSTWNTVLYYTCQFSKIPGSYNVDVRSRGRNYAVQGHSRSFKVTDFDTIRKFICDFLLVINSNLPPILHRFRDIALERSKIAVFGYPSLVFPIPTRRKGSPEISQMAKLPIGLETLPKISIP